MQEKPLTYRERRAQEPMYRYFESATALIFLSPIVIILADLIGPRWGDAAAIACLVAFVVYNLYVGYKFRRQEDSER